MDEETVDALVEQHEETREALRAHVEDSQERDQKRLDILHEQNETQAMQTEVLRGIKQQVEEEASTVKNRIIYALLALLAGVLYEAGAFTPIGFTVTMPL